MHLLGRWGSEAVKGYFREAPLQALLQRSPQQGLDIDAIVDQITQKLGRTHVGGASAPMAPELVEAQDLAQEAAVLSHPAAGMALVVNDASGVTHRQASDKLACCGWSYHRRPHTKVSGPVQDHCFLCGNCFPDAS